MGKSVERTGKFPIPGVLSTQSFNGHFDNKKTRKTETGSTMFTPGSHDKLYKAASPFFRATASM